VVKREGLIAFRVSAQERKMIEKGAKRHKMDVSDYVRSCVYFDLVMDGDVEALKFTAVGVRQAVAARVRRIMGGAERPQEEM
jgi:hypothetical protein